MSAPADRPLTEEEAMREAELALSRPIPVYDPRPFTLEQEARIAEIAEAAIDAALRNTRRQSKRGI
jgi:hypothetical protein